MQAVEIPLQDEDGGEAVAHGPPTATGQVGLDQDPLGLGAGEPLVERDDWDGELLLQRAGEVERFAGHLSERSIHVPRQADDRSGDMVLSCESRKEGHVLAKSAAKAGRKRARQDSTLV